MSRGEYVRRLLVAAAVAVAAALLVRGLPRLAQTGLVLFTGVLFAVVIDGFASFVGRQTPIPRKAAAVATVLGLFALAALVTWWFGPRMAEQFGELLERVPEVVDDMIAGIEDTEWGGMLLDRLRRSPDALPDGGEALGGATRVFSSLASAVTGALVILFVGLFAAYDPPAYREAVLDMLPREAQRERATDVMHELARTLKLWMKARLISMAVVGVLTAVGLTIAGVPLALALALIAAVLAFVPFIGPIVSGIPAIVVGLGEGVELALVVAGIYVGVQVIESYLVEPLVERRMISLPPALVIAAQIVMGTLFGLLGVFLATPAAVVGIVLVQQLYLRDQLDKDPEPLGA